MELSPRRGDAWIPSCSIIFVYHDKPSPRWGESSAGRPLLSVEWPSFDFFDYPDRVAAFMFSRVVMPDDLDSLRVVRSQSSAVSLSDGWPTVPLWVNCQCGGRFRLINNIILMIILCTTFPHNYFYFYFSHAACRLFYCVCFPTPPGVIWLYSCTCRS